MECKKEITRLVINEIKKREIASKEIAEKIGVTDRFINQLKAEERVIRDVDLANKFLKELRIKYVLGE